MLYLQFPFLLCHFQLRLFRQTLHLPLQWEPFPPQVAQSLLGQLALLGFPQSQMTGHWLRKKTGSNLAQSYFAILQLKLLCSAQSLLEVDSLHLRGRSQVQLLDFQ